MNKHNKALILGLMVTLAPVCCAEEVQVPAQEQIVQPSCTDACQVPAQVAPVTEPTEQTAQATQVVPAETVVPATEAQPEPEMTEEQLQEFLDQLISELKKEEEAKKKKAAASQQTEAQPVEAQVPVVQ